MKIQIRFPLNDLTLIERLKAGDEIEISGVIYSARDAAHTRLIKALDNKTPMPFKMGGNLIYYMGPTPAPPGRVIGSCGPTTSIRMDKYTLPLMRAGLKATMGKGNRGAKIAEGCKKYKAVYLIAYGGCGAYLNRFVKRVKCHAYCKQGPEAIYKIEVEKFPAIVGIDTKGKNLYNITD